MPDSVRKQSERLSPDDTLLKIIATLKKPPQDSENARDFRTRVLNRKPEYLESNKDLTKFKNVYDWHFMFLSSTKNSPDLRIFIGKLKLTFYDRSLNKFLDVSNLVLISVLIPSC